MKAESIKKIREALDCIDRNTLNHLCLSLAKFKIENKELISYLLFEAENEDEYINKTKRYVNEMFSEINTTNYFYVKKSVRRILKKVRKYCRYSNHNETEVELLLYFCHQMCDIKPSIFKNKTLSNIFVRLLNSIENKTIKLHEDLQYEYNIEIQKLNNKI